jgi:hypothetical protein
MKRTIVLAAAIALTAGVAEANGVGGPSFARATCGAGVLRFFGVREVVGLTSDQRLVCFNSNHPSASRPIGEVSGLIDDTRLLGIDFRPADRKLYGLGDARGVYVIDVDTGEATLRSRLNVPALEGTFFDVDFNPTVDRLRIVSDSGQNLRANVDTGATTEDLDLVYMATATGVSGAAYTNNDASPDTATTLYDIDASLDQVVVQAPPNNGNLNPTGKILADAADDVGFDIYATVRDGRTIDNLAYAAFKEDDRPRFFRINLLTGRASRVGSFAPGIDVTDIALPLNQF